MDFYSSALDFEGQRIDGVGRIGIRIFNSLTVGCSGNHAFCYTVMRLASQPTATMTLP